MPQPKTCFIPEMLWKLLTDMLS